MKSIFEAKESDFTFQSNMGKFRYELKELKCVCIYGAEIYNWSFGLTQEREITLDKSYTEYYIDMYIFQTYHIKRFSIYEQTAIQEGEVFNVEMSLECPLPILVFDKQDKWIDPELIQLSLDKDSDTAKIIADKLEDKGCPEPMLISHFRHWVPHLTNCVYLQQLWGMS